MGTEQAKGIKEGTILELGSSLYEVGERKDDQVVALYELDKDLKRDRYIGYINLTYHEFTIKRDLIGVKGAVDF